MSAEAAAPPARGMAGIFLRITLPLAGVNLINQAARAVMSLVGPILAVEYGLSASELGLLSAALFIGYGLWQVPVGLLLDIYGPRRVQTAMSLVAAAGFFLFSVENDLLGFAVARVLTGVGVAGALIGILKANSQWFTRQQIAGVTGLALMVGGLGGLLVTVPANALLPVVGWRGLFVILGVMASLIAVWNWLSVRDRAMPPRRTLRAEIGVIGAIWSSKVFWRFAPAVAWVTMLNFTYQGLWAGPWLRDVAGMDGGQRATTLLCYALGLMTGSMVTGQLASRLQARGYSPMLVPFVCMGAIMAIQAVLVTGPTDPVLVRVLWVLFPLFVSVGPSGFSAIAQLFPVEQMGRVSTAINSANLAGVFVLQSLIGWILDLWPRNEAGGWDRHGYEWAFGLTLAVQIGLTIWALTGVRRYARG